LHQSLLEHDCLIANSFASFSFFGSAEADALAVAAGDGDLDSHQCEFSHSLSRSVMGSTVRATRLRGQEYPHLVKSPFDMTALFRSTVSAILKLIATGIAPIHIRPLLGIITTMYIGKVPRQEW
jgi:hypothetical protein